MMHQTNQGTDVVDPLTVLLDVQAHDTKLDQLLHRQENLPARIDRDAAQGALGTLEADLATTSTRRDELARDQKRLDDEVESLNAKRKGYDTKLYSGTVSNPRELQDLQEEIEALGRRIDQLEEQELEIMEQVEPVEARRLELSAAVEAQAAALATAELHLTAAETELVVDLEAETAARATVAEGVPAELLDEYAHLRGGRGGTGVAKLIGSQCGGCHLTLSAVEVAHCEECGRILVP